MVAFTYDHFKAERANDPARVGYAGRSDEAVLILANAPRVTGSEIGELSARELYDGISTDKIASIADAAATTTAQGHAGAAAVDSYLATVGSISLAPGTPGRLAVEACVGPNRPLQIDDVNALVRKATRPVLLARSVELYGRELTLDDVLRSK